MGSNSGDRRAHLKSAVSRFYQHHMIWKLALSSVYETEPLGDTPQGLYLNAVMRLDTTLSPREVLELCLDEEQQRGRKRSEERYAARSLDLDLLLYGNEIIAEEDLIVPHPRMLERAFVLEPLAELAPQLLHPLTGTSIGELAADVHDSVRVRRTPIRFH
jgi:2-amino-4-hydroxy-6-hydroxymethyldihydropteridine diphosphokinase